jgi:hypothetical protein
MNPEVETMTMAKIKNSLTDFFNIDDLEIDEARETELIEKIAQKVSQMNLELPAIVLGYGFWPMAKIQSYLTLLPMATTLGLIGINMYDYVALFDEKNNVKRLIDRLDELQTNKDLF